MSVFEDLEVFTDQDKIKNWATKPFVIGSLTNANSVSDSYDQTRHGDVSLQLGSFSGTSVTYADIKSSVTLCSYNNDGLRKVGYVSGVLDDGSLVVSILGTGVIPFSASKAHYVTNLLTSRTIFQNKIDAVFETMAVDGTVNNKYWQAFSPSVGLQNAGMAANIGTGGANSWLTNDQGLLYQPAWQTSPSGGTKNYVHNIIYLFGYKNSQRVGNLAYVNEIQLTDNEISTLTIGNNYTEYEYTLRGNVVYSNGYANIGGALSAIESKEIDNLSVVISGMSTTLIDGNPHVIVPPTTGTYAGYYCPFNLILTRNLEQAKSYLTTGTLPDDAFLYPFDVDNIPTNDSGNVPDPTPVDPDPGGNEPDEDANANDNVQPTPTVTPTISPLSLTNNNLYWLAGAELQSFIDWFWTDAADIATLGDLWDKIRGLYENLAEAIINIRFMPVDVSWIVGHTNTVPSIIVGQIEKQGSVLSLNKKLVNDEIVSDGQVSPIRTLNTTPFEIPVRFNGGFANYSPYASMSLYLPFHGFVDLDIDLFIGKTITVQCVYDVVSGTVQYYVFRGDATTGQLVQSVVAKMAVDIPITLQTKNQRDSATFQNVSNAVGSLIGAGASLAAGSPIGLTMAMGSFVGTQTQGASLTLKGTVGESGAFYQPRKCAIYIKRPNYNRPDIYASRVGYPSNKSKQLKSCKGFTQVYNPYIEFTHGIRPYKEEIDMIYDYLKEGVIL